MFLHCISNHSLARSIFVLSLEYSAQGQVFHCKPGSQAAVLLGMDSAVASCCFKHPTLSLASEQTLKDLKTSQGHQRGEETGFG